jgi:hypothetical protein
MTHPTRNPNRAAVSEQYVAAPPSRQPRGSSGVTSRDAAPTTIKSRGPPEPAGDPSYTPLASDMQPPWSRTMFFYELREGDENIFADVLLVREEEMDADSFFELVQEIRRRVQDTFTQDTLIEAVAEELERDHAFIAISDERLSASVNVSKLDDDNYLASIDSDDDDDPDAPDYRGIFVNLPRDGFLPN